MEQHITRLYTIAVLLGVGMMLHLCSHTAQASDRLITPKFTSVNCDRAEVHPISKGDLVECDGFFFTDKAEREAAKARDDAKYYKQLVPSLEERLALEQKRGQILEKRLNLYLDLSSELAEDRIKSENMKFWERAGMFILGAAVMYGAVDLAR